MLMQVANLPDLPEIASQYSQLAGILAGFAFAGFVALVAAQFGSQSDTSSTVESIVPLTGAFLGLIITSLNYAIIAGEVQGSARVADLQVVAGIGFGVAGLMLLYSMLVLLRGLEMTSQGVGLQVGGLPILSVMSLRPPCRSWYSCTMVDSAITKTPHMARFGHQEFIGSTSRRG